jgi:hypothetical protein
MSDYSRWSTSSIVCAPFLDTHFELPERAAMLMELRHRGYPRAVVFVLRVFAGVGLWWNLIAWEWADLDLTDVLFGYSLNFGLVTLALAVATVLAFVRGGSVGLFAALSFASAVLCLLLFFAASRNRKSGERAA